MIARTTQRKETRMKKTLMILLICAVCVSIFGCKKKTEMLFVDTLPCDQASGFTWVVRASSGDTGKVFVDQIYRDDETYALLGASGVMEHDFAGVEPGVATIRLYYVHASDWDGLNSSAEGTAYYEFLVHDDLSISLMYSEVELPDSF